MNIEKKAKLFILLSGVFGAIILVIISVLWKAPYIYAVLFILIFAILVVLLEMYLRIQHNIDRNYALFERDLKKIEGSQKLEAAVGMLRNNMVDLLQRLIEKMDLEMNKIETGMESYKHHNYEDSNNLIVKKIEGLDAKLEDGRKDGSFDDIIDNINKNTIKIEEIYHKIQDEMKTLSCRDSHIADIVGEKMKVFPDKDFTKQNTQIILNYLLGLQEKNSAAIEKLEKLIKGSDSTETNVYAEYKENSI